MWILDIPIVLADSSSINISTEDGYHSRHFIFFERASFLKEKCASVDFNRNVSLLDEWTSILSFWENKSAAQYFLIYLCLMSSDADPDRSWSGLSHAYYDLKMFSWWRWYVHYSWMWPNLDPTLSFIIRILKMRNICKLCRYPKQCCVDPDRFCLNPPTFLCCRGVNCPIYCMYTVLWRG